MDQLLWIALFIFLFAGTIKGTVGIGLPTASISILSQFYDPFTAISLVIFPVMVSNFWQVYRSKDVMRIARTYWPFALMLTIFIMICTQLSANIPVNIIMIILGTVIILFSLTSLFVHPPELPARLDRPAQFIAGTLAGIMGGFTAIWAPPMVIYLVSRRIEKDDFVRATGFLLSMGSIPLCIGYWINGFMTGPLASTSLLMIVTTLLGFTIGEMIRKKINPDKFQKVVLIIFLLMGLNIIRKALL
ncbi:sulfite exporter TauE/SafE family protein [Terasakiella sp. A23]|uniref:sulfite exporter TauE/SafE family protein n=1 Tax=Terasakiella sp. FCG-A23 TaxID=3080561 RepID=UPI002953FECE|nr:sulfite exporter TauE/SafE family protein [Terasakiella sp. A23]MDV7338056.1 sulfite exporter TauE/SafE family protein [Terasakiella sp. A23]